MLHLTRLWILGAALALTLAALADKNSMATVTPFRQAPVLDGKISPGEWDGAVSTAGFQDIQGLWLEARLGRSYCGFTQDRLYLAVVSEVSPNGPTANQKNRDSDVIWDEGIEIWLDPNRDSRASGEGDLGFYQFMGNAIGTIQDVRFDSKKGTPDVGWNGQWQFENSVDMQACLWTAELSIPFTDLGWKPGAPIGRSIGILLARNYKSPWSQSTWFPHNGAFVSWFEYPRIHFTTDAPSVQITSLGDKVFSGAMNLSARIYNPGPARQVQVKYHAKSSDMPDLVDEKLLALPANGTATYAYNIPAGHYHEFAQHNAVFLVQAPDGAQQYLNFSTKWKQAPEKKWHVRTGPNPDGAVRFAYYPSYKFVRVLVDTRELEKAADAIKSAKVTLTGPDGKVVFTNGMTWEKAPATQEFPTPDLAEGRYTLTVTLDGYKTVFTRTFTRTRFPWENNRLGITNTVYPPFTPIQVAGNDLNVALRRYRVNGLGLWDSVESCTKELLAAPIALKVDEGQTLTGTGKFTATRADAAIFQGQAAAPGVTVKTTCTTEYDGCMKVELTLAPGTAKQELKALWLEIPLKDSEAPLWHASTSGLRQNPAGATPPGAGEVWDSRKFPDGNWYGNFKPYLWLGGGERGLCWFADNDAGWVLNVEKDVQTPCLVLHRANGVLTLRVNLVQKPVTLTEPRTIVFGVMASPAKPMMKDWRKLSLTKSIGFSMSYAGDNVCSSKTPHGGDFSIFDRMQEARLTGNGNVDDYWKYWAAKHVTPEMEKPVADRFRSLFGTIVGWSASKPPYFSYYFEEFHSTCQTHPESHVFQSEWSGGWMSALQEKFLRGDAAGSIGTGNLVRSYQDFACWYAAEHLRRGIGLYFDNAFPKRAYDLLTSTAYRLPNGEIQPSAGMWAHREYLKRIWVLHQQIDPAGTRPMMMVHMTNTHCIPYLSFNMANLDLEWFYGPEPQQSKYPYDLLLAESLGRQSGTLPLAIAKVDNTKSKEEERIAYRTRFGALMVHEIRPYMSEMIGTPYAKMLVNFGYGEDYCQVLNYWQDAYPVHASNPQVKTLLLKRGHELLLLIVTWNPKAETVTLTLDQPTLGLVLTEARDEETNDALTFSKGKLTVPLEGYGVRFVRVK
jgi:hypothetical protein